MWWIRYESNGPAQAHRLRAALTAGGIKRVVIASSNGTLAPIREDHVEGPWWRKFNSDHNVKPTIETKDIDKIKFVRTKCDKLVLPALTNRHAGNCHACQRLKTNAEQAAQNGTNDTVQREDVATAAPSAPPIAPEPVVPSEPQQEQTMIASLEARRDEALSIAADLDSIVNALKSLGGMAERFAALKAEQAKGRAELVALIGPLA